MDVHKRSRQDQACGFTLIEVLVAVMILALGAAGVAAMQLHALRTARHSGLQSTALQLAVDLAELLRLHGSATGEFAPFDDDAAGNATSPSPSACTGPGCELAAWKQRLHHHLPRARAVLCRDSVPTDGTAPHWPCNGAQHSPLVIKVGWSTADAAPAHTLATPFLILLVDE